MTFSLEKPLDFLGHVPKRPSPIPHFFSFTEKEALEQALLQPHRIFIELGKYDKTEALLEPLLSDTPDMMLSLTTAGAYHNYTARVIAGALNERFGLQGYKSLQIETCLHEAMLNAVIHGNLAMHSIFGTLDEMQAFYTRLEEYLLLDNYKYRRIFVRAWDMNHHFQIAISDEGSGFALVDDIQDTGLPHGRGLHFIRDLADHVWVGEDHRTLYMSFSY